MSEQYLAIQVIMMPRDVNPHGTIFGGVLLSYIDQAGAIGAYRAVVQAGGRAAGSGDGGDESGGVPQAGAGRRCGALLTRPVRIGRTSITMQVSVEADRAGQVLHVTEAEVVYVGVDLSTPERRPRPLLGP